MDIIVFIAIVAAAGYVAYSKVPSFAEKVDALIAKIKPKA